MLVSKISSVAVIGASVSKQALTSSDLRGGAYYAVELYRYVIVSYCYCRNWEVNLNRQFSVTLQLYGHCRVFSAACFPFHTVSSLTRHSTFLSSSWSSKCRLTLCIDCVVSTKFILLIVKVFLSHEGLHTECFYR